LISLVVSYAIAFFLISSGWATNRTPLPRDRPGMPIWTVDLRTVIGSEPLGLVVGQGRETQAKPRTSLWFLDKTTIAVTFVTRQAKSKLSSRDGSDVSSPLQVRLILLDGASGNVRNNKSWPTESRFAGIVTMHDGKFVMQRGLELVLFSSDLTEVKTLKLPRLEEADWHAHPSPSGKNVLFIATSLRTSSAIPWIWVDVDSLTVLRSWKETQSGWVAISDQRMAMTTCVWVYSCKPEVMVRSIDGDWETVALATKNSKPRLQFVDDSTLYLLGSPARLIRTDGRVLFTEENAPEGCWWGEPVPSSTGLRFVVPSCKVKGVISSLDMAGHDVLRKILVFDAPFDRVTHVIDISGPTIKDLSSLALSPDGLSLAILNNELLEVLPLPRPQ